MSGSSVSLRAALVPRKEVMCWLFDASGDRSHPYVTASKNINKLQFVTSVSLDNMDDACFAQYLGLRVAQLLAQQYPPEHTLPRTQAAQTVSRTHACLSCWLLVGCFPRSSTTQRKSDNPVCNKEKKTSTNTPSRVPRFKTHKFHNTAR